MDKFKKIASLDELEALKNLIHYENSGEHKPQDMREKLLCDFTKPVGKIKSISESSGTLRIASFTLTNAETAKLIKEADVALENGAEYIEIVPESVEKLTCKEYFNAYCECAIAIKAAHPEIKVGSGGFENCVSDYVHEFMNYLANDKRVPLDFFSWHKCAAKAEQVQNYTYAARTLLDKYGFGETENIISSWRYDAVDISNVKLQMKEAAFVAATLISLQKTPADMAVYGKENFGESEKCRLAFSAFGMLSSLGIEVTSDSAADHVYVLGAKNDDKGAFMAVNFNPYEEAEHECVLDLKGIFGKSCEIYLLDEAHNLEVVYSGKVPESYKLFANSVMVVKLI